MKTIRRFSHAQVAGNRRDRVNSYGLVFDAGVWAGMLHGPHETDITSDPTHCPITVAFYGLYGAFGWESDRP